MEIKDKQKELLEIAKTFDEICQRNGIRYSLAFGSVLGAVRHSGFIPWDPDMDVYVRIEDRERLRKALEEELKPPYLLKNWELDPKFPDGHDVVFRNDVSIYELRFDVFYLVGFCNDDRKRQFETKLNKKLYGFFRCKHKDVRYSNKLNGNARKSKIVKVFAQIVPDAIIMGHYRRVERRYPLDTAEYIGWHATARPVRKSFILGTKRVDFEGVELPIPVKSHEYLTSMYGDYMTPRDWSKSRVRRW